MLVFSPPFRNGMIAATVAGQPNFTSNTCAVTATGQVEPFGVSISP